MGFISQDMYVFTARTRCCEMNTQVTRVRRSNINHVLDTGPVKDIAVGETKHENHTATSKTNTYIR